MIKLDFAKNKCYAVMGLGISGRLAARALAKAGANVLAWDDIDNARNQVLGIKGVQLENLNFHGLDKVHALILSPGIPHTYPKPHPVAAEAKRRGLPIIGDIELLLRALPNRKNIIITGTNGKSTTTALISHLLTSNGLRVEVGGNLGRPVLNFNDPGRDGILVLELSSYQLELTPSIAPTIAVWLNISIDHIERHGNLAGYVAAKQRIFANQCSDNIAIVVVDDEQSSIVANTLRQNGNNLIEVSNKRPILGGIYVDQGFLIDARSSQPNKIFDLKSVQSLPGAHNEQNAAAATAACLALGFRKEVIARTITSFLGLAHRLELVAVYDNVTYVNDSKATNAIATAQALATYNPIYWIVGGRAKEGGIERLTPWLNRIKRAYLIGESAKNFLRQIGNNCPTVLSYTLENATWQAHAEAQEDNILGATVLLSPAAASFDQFPNFEVRGEQFKALVRALTYNYSKKY
ncbi:UDP-N-acetylmuramoylalanine--D-glutamate ligase [Candidatus Endolissoclinum faulkneri L5]|uniref:UDP-N-acetylmuramoylalanine--D-glutamate ligase n=1 Tax=Candidatus Endolissoclinum faulkneri L5 TaxID=1401328 RepID=V9TX06_9PROT|nr:UDP-N-acetylmuramoyl-L-alanine--D-glutamate ligase [Candidatus Endolissoclinum faulkneri]AHC73860.1 UDP-N-acetylmuramoylalanine--D-glutamate ligase [Candidatus Endolissoclinum faulkneri L5]